VRRTRTSSRCTAGYLETDVVRAVAAPKGSGRCRAQVLDAIEAGDDEVLADATSRQVRPGLCAEPTLCLARNAA